MQNNFFIHRYPNTLFDQSVLSHIAYVENKIEDPNNVGVIINGGEPLLESVKDVRGYTWNYEYEQSDLDSLNFLFRSLSPTVDSDGDDTADGTIILKELDYTLSSGEMQSINQKLGKQGIEDLKL